MSVFSDLNGWTERADELCRQLDELNRNLREFPRNEQQHSRGYNEWERFALIDGGNASAGGALTIGGANTNLRPAPNGWEAFVTSIAVTVSGASAAATLTVYNGDLADQNLADYANALLGASPSRIKLTYQPEEFYVEQGDCLTLVLASTAASATVTVRICGKRRQT